MMMIAPMTRAVNTARAGMTKPDFQSVAVVRRRKKEAPEPSSGSIVVLPSGEVMLMLPSPP